MKYKRMSDVDLRGKRVFIRADLNVPLEDGRITDDTRIRASVPAIKQALEQGAAVMVTSHLGRPTEGELKPEDSLAPVAKRLAELLGRELPLIGNWVNGVDVKPGQVVLLENCRVNKGEKKDDSLIVGGGIANTFLLAAGKPIGKSLAEPDLAPEARKIASRTKVPLPSDVVVGRSLQDTKGTTKPVSGVTSDEMILDIGPETAGELARSLKQAGTIVWNGPMGVFENAAFAKGTETLAHAIAESKAFS